MICCEQPAAGRASTRPRFRPRFCSGDVNPSKRREVEESRRVSFGLPAARSRGVITPKIGRLLSFPWGLVMPIPVTCPCGRQYTFKDEFAGCRATCPECGTVVVIPGKRAASAIEGAPPPEAEVESHFDLSSPLIRFGLGAVALILLVGLGIAGYFVFRSPRLLRSDSGIETTRSAPMSHLVTKETAAGASVSKSESASEAAPPRQSAQASAEEPQPANREAIGRWLDVSARFSCRITLFREDGNLYVEEKYSDGSGGKQGVVESESSLGRRLDPVERNRSGDHWIIDQRGSLQIRDDQGLIRTASKIE